MLNQYEPNVKAVIAFLRLLKVRVNSSTVNEAMLNHPDWPSLLCISDSLNKWNVPNGAGKIDVEDIDRLPAPFIAYTRDEEYPLTIVVSVNGETVGVYEKSYRKLNHVRREDFMRKWSGVYLIAEPNEHSGEPGYASNRQKAFFNSLIPIGAFAALIVLSFIFMRETIAAVQAVTASATFGLYLQYFLHLAGVIVTALLLWYEMDQNNPLLKKVCTGIAKGNCSAILTSRQAKVFSWLSWSEVGFFYFAGGLLVLLFAGNSVASSIALVSWFNALALPYPVFSVYYQWRVAKQWCVLCLVVQALLVVGGMNVLLGGFLFPLPYLTTPFLFTAGLLYVVPVLIWYTVKPYILQLQEAKNIKRAYLRIKFNTEIYETLLKKQKSVTVPVDGLGIDLGNPVAKNTLIKVCNPYCGPCSKAHTKIEKLLAENENLKVKIIFATPNNEDYPAIKPVRHLLAINAEGNKERMQTALDDWYHAEVKDYNFFASQYPMNGELMKQHDKIKAMDDWCKKMGIVFTPTIFINGYQLPDAYNIEDLQYFLLA